MQTHYDKAITLLKNALVYLNTKVSQEQSGPEVLIHFTSLILRP